jgi:hypothetical protein
MSAHPICHWTFERYTIQKGCFLFIYNNETVYNFINECINKGRRLMCCTKLSSVTNPYNASKYKGKNSVNRHLLTNTMNNGAKYD